MKHILTDEEMAAVEAGNVSNQKAIITDEEINALDKDYTASDDIINSPSSKNTNGTDYLTRAKSGFDKQMGEMRSDIDKGDIPVLAKTSHFPKALSSYATEFPGVKQVGDVLGKAFNATLQPIDREIIAGASNLYNKLPGDWKNLAETLLNIESIPFSATLGKGLTKGGIEGTSKILSKTLLKDNYSESLDMLVGKGMKPGISSQRTVNLRDKFRAKTEEAVKLISENRDKLNLVDDAGNRIDFPTNMREFEDAIVQTKELIYPIYKKAEALAGGISGFNPDRALRVLKEFENARERVPGIRRAAASMRKEIEELRGMSPEDISKRIQDYNGMLKGSYLDPRWQAKGTVAGGVATILREDLDKQISNVLGNAGYQDLKNQYGALSHIENDVRRRSLYDMRKNVNGLTDLSNMYFAMEAVGAIASNNPMALFRPAAGFATKTAMKKANDPNTYVKKVFTEASKRYGTKPLQAIEEPIRRTGGEAFRETPTFLREGGNMPILESNRQIPFDNPTLGESGVIDELKRKYPNLSDEALLRISRESREKKQLPSPMIDNNDIKTTLPSKPYPVGPSGERVGFIGDENFSLNDLENVFPGWKRIAPKLTNEEKEEIVKYLFMRGNPRISAPIDIKQLPGPSSIYGPIDPYRNNPIFLMR